MNEAREIRLRVLEMLVRAGCNPDDIEVETVHRMERFVMAANVAKPEVSADSAASETDPTGTA